MNKGILTVILLIVFAFDISLIIYINPSIDFSVDNKYWNGYSRFAGIVHPTILYNPITSLSKYPPENTCLIIIPYKKYSNIELDTISKFLSEGGSMILLNDHGYGNEILEYLNAPLRIDESGILIDPLFKYKDGRLPEILTFKNDISTRNISSIYLDYATILDVLNSKAIILGESSIFSYFDRNFDNMYDKGDGSGPFPILARFRYGKGVVYVLSDPSMVSNGMIGMGDNLKLIKNMIGNRKVLIDQYHLKKNIHYIVRESLISIYNSIKQRYVLSYLSIALIMGLSFLIIKRFF